MVFVDWDYNWLFLLACFIYFFIMYTRYRNSGTRHIYETETKKEISNMKKVDIFLQSRTGLRNSMMEGANNTRLNGKLSNNNLALDKFTQNNIVNSLTKNNQALNVIKDKIDNKDRK